MTFGTSPEDHDLSLLKEPLRSHGGITEQNVPFIINKKINITNTKSLRNFHAFHYATLASKIWKTELMIKNKIKLFILTLNLFLVSSAKSYEVTLPNFGFICINDINNEKFVFW